MRTRSSPSRYRYCMSFRSTMASPTFTPALNVRSRTAPVFRFRSFVRTNAPPLPGFTCWNSTTWNNVPSKSRVMPRFRSLVETLIALQDHQVLRGSRDDPASVRRHLDHVLDPNAPEATHVDARLHRHHGPLGQDVLRSHPERGPFVDLQPHPVSQGVGVVVPIPGLADHLPRDRIDVSTDRAGPDRVDAGLLCPADHLVDLPEPGRRLAEGDGPGHVGVIAVDHAA